jgi:hypothetical protein
MGKIYESQEDYEKAFEEDFKHTVEEIGYYQGDLERTTLDGEWTEEDLKDDVWDEANKILNGDKKKGTKGWIEQHEGRAVKDIDLLKVEYMVEDICSRYDIIEVYNKAVDYNRNNPEKKFGICYFDELVRAEVNKVLKNNLLTH